MPLSCPSRARPRNGFVRYRLRTFLLAAPLVGAFVGTWGVSWHRSWREAQAVASVEALAGTVLRDDRQQVVRVDLSGRQVTDAQLRQLVSYLIYLPTLKELSLSSTEVGDAGLVEVAQLSQLERLTIYDSRTTYAGMARLTQDRPDLEIHTHPPHIKAMLLAMRKIYSRAVVAVAFSPNGRALASGDGDGVLRLWRLDPSRRNIAIIPTALQAQANWLFTIAFRPDGELLATGGGDNLIRLWNGQTLAHEGDLSGHEDDVHAITFSPDGERLYSTGDDGTVRAWSIGGNTALWTAEGHREAIPSLALNPQGTMLASGSRDDDIRLWNNAGELLGVLRGHQGDVMSLAFSPDGGSLLSASYDKTLRIWDLASRRTTRVLTGHGDWVFAAAWSPDGALLASGAGDGMRWWDARTGDLLFRTRRQVNTSQLSFRRDSLVLASSSADGDIRLWNVPGRYEKESLRSYSEEARFAHRR